MSCCADSTGTNLVDCNIASPVTGRTCLEGSGGFATSKVGACFGGTASLTQHNDALAFCSSFQINQEICVLLYRPVWCKKLSHGEVKGMGCQMHSTGLSYAAMGKCRYTAAVLAVCGQGSLTSRH